MTATQITKLTEKEFSEFIMNNALVVVKFSAAWCAPCKVLTPVVEAVAAENPTVSFIEIDIDDAPLLAKELDITSVPTLHFYKDGNLMVEKTGVMTKPKLMIELTKALY